MKKLFILNLVIILLVLTGCTIDKKVEGEEVVKTVYCDSCAEESEEVTKFCSNCGEEAKWVYEKPNIKNVKEYKDKSEEVNKIVKEAEKNIGEDVESKIEIEEISKIEVLSCRRCGKQISDLENINLKGYCQECSTCDKCGFIPDAIGNLEEYKYEFDFEAQKCKNVCVFEEEDSSKYVNCISCGIDEDIAKINHLHGYGYIHDFCYESLPNCMNCNDIICPGDDEDLNGICWFCEN